MRMGPSLRTAGSPTRRVSQPPSGFCTFGLHKTQSNGMKHRIMKVRRIFRSHRPHFGVACGFTLAFFLTAPFAGAQDPAENAALHYLKASAAILNPTTRVQLEWVRFIDEDLPQLPPRVFVAQPEALRWLAAEQVMLAALSDGAAITPCAFPIERADSPFPDRTHHVLLRRLTHRALAAAKAYEYSDNFRGAGRIYADLLRMIQHLAAERTLFACMAASELTQSVAGELEGFFSREPPPEAYTELLRAFDESREQVFRPATALREEAKRVASWLLAKPSDVENRLDLLYGEARNRPAVERLITLDASAKEARLREWVKGYVSWMEALAVASEKPYSEAIERIQKLDEQRKRMLRDPATANPLIPLLAPEYAPLYQRALLGEAQFDVADLLCLAGAYRAETRLWPENTTTLAAMLRFRTLAKDPFSGRPFYYRLSRGSPAVTIQVPRWMARDSKYYYEFVLADRLERDRRLAEAYVREWQKKLLLQAAEPVPLR